MNPFHELNKVDKLEKLIEKYSLNTEDFIDIEDLMVFVNYLEEPSVLISEMANFYGKEIKIEKIPFSFFISTKSAVHGAHGIRAKIKWNTDKITDADGSLDLHGDYNYRIGSHKYKPTAKELQLAKEFFKKYKVLFAAVWENVLNPWYLQKYFEGTITFKRLLAHMQVHEEDDPEDIDYYNINHCNSLSELEGLIRRDQLYNMND